MQTLSSRRDARIPPPPPPLVRTAVVYYAVYTVVKTVIITFVTLNQGGVRAGDATLAYTTAYMACGGAEALTACISETVGEMMWGPSGVRGARATRSRLSVAGVLGRWSCARPSLRARSRASAGATGVPV